MKRIFFFLLFLLFSFSINAGIPPNRNGGGGGGIPEAPTDSEYYGRYNSTWEEVCEEAPNDGSEYVRKNEAWSISSGGGISDAPSDSTAYGREDAAWVNVCEEAPSDGTQYARKDAGWEAVSAGLADAPSDGSAYGREDAAWVNVTEEAPNDTKLYVRQDEAWTEAVEPPTTPYGFRGYLASDQSIDSDVHTVLDFITETDTQSWFNDSTHLYTPQRAGYYKFVCNVQYLDMNISPSKTLITAIQKNGTRVRQRYDDSGIAGNSSMVVGTVYANGSSDYFSCSGFQNDTTAKDVGSSTANTYFEINFLGITIGIDDAPSNGNEYVRKDAAWSIAAGSLPTASWLWVDRNGVNQSITSGVVEKVEYTTVRYDTQGAWQGSPNYNYKPSAGLYFIIAHLTCATGVEDQMNASIYKNSTLMSYSPTWPVSSGASTASRTMTMVLPMNGTDTMHMGAYQTAGIDKNLNGGIDRTFFQVFKIGNLP